MIISARVTSRNESSSDVRVMSAATTEGPNGRQKGEPESLARCKSARYCRINETMKFGRLRNGRGSPRNLFSAVMSREQYADAWPDRGGHIGIIAVYFSQELAVSALEFDQRMAIIGELRRLRCRLSRALSNAAKPKLKTAQSFQEIRDSLLIRMWACCYLVECSRVCSVLLAVLVFGLIWKYLANSAGIESVPSVFDPAQILRKHVTGNAR